MCNLVNPDEEDELGHEKAAAQVLVDRGSGVLNVSEEPECEDTQGQAYYGDHHSQLRYPRQNIIMRKQLHKTEQEKAFRIVYKQIVDSALIVPCLQTESVVFTK